MQEKTPSVRDTFGSKLGIIAAAAGSAIGLGNIWRFPYVVGNNGGAAFLTIYFAFVIGIGVPVMISEFIIGRRAQRNPFGAFRKLAPKTSWYLVGIMGIVAAFTILSFYSTIAGWTIEYLREAFATGFQGMDKETLNTHLNEFQNNGYLPVFYQLIFMFLTGFVVYSGVKNGIEKYTKILMPVLLVIIIIIDINALMLPGSAEGLKFLFQPDFSKITTSVVLEALGQAFFSLSIGMGTLITYGSYIQKKNDLGITSVQVSIADTFIAILAGIAIFPAVFSFGITPDAGPSLVFVTLPLIFEQMAGGYFFAIIFFILLSIAALTSTISVLEVVVAFLSEEMKMTRKKATLISASLISVLGVFVTLSQGPMPELAFFGKDLFEWMDFLSANVLLPLGGLMIVLFVGWSMNRKDVFDELSNGNTLKVVLFKVYYVIIRFIAPVAIILVFLDSLGII
jgi:NSS family neurotransmitter:Na+ symporter